MISTLEEAIHRMKAKFESVGRELAAWPARPGAPELEVQDVESRLGAALPPTFRTLVRDYDFLNAVAGNVAMTHATSLNKWLASPNVEPLPRGRARWWTGARRPPSLVLIASSDAHSFLLDLDSGEIRALWIDEPERAAARIASDFSEFYRGLVSVYLAGLGTNDAEAEANVVASHVGADPDFPFWTRFAQNAAQRGSDPCSS